MLASGSRWNDEARPKQTSSQVIPIIVVGESRQRLFLVPPTIA
jgi:hypothetical protein